MAAGSGLKSVRLTPTSERHGIAAFQGSFSRYGSYGVYMVTRSRCVSLQGAADLGSREPWEVFYAAPSVTATAFLCAAAEGARTVASEQSVPAALRLADLTILARTVMVRSFLLSGTRRACH